MSVHIPSPSQRRQTYPAHGIFNNPTHIPYSDTHTRRIQEPDILLPRKLSRCSRRSVIKPAVPNRRNNNKETKDEDLQDEAAEDDVFAALKAVLAGGGDEHACAACLDEEAENVAADEELGEPCGAYERVLYGVGSLYETSEDHVYGGCEEDGGEEDECGLNDVGCFGCGVAVCCGAGRVAYGFTLLSKLVCEFCMVLIGSGGGYTYCGTNDERNTEPCPILDQPEDVDEE
jgi:hypothetical protein